METSGPAKKWVKMTTHPVQAGLRRNSIFFGQKCILSQKTAKNAFYPKKRPKFLKRLIFIAPKVSAEGACLLAEMGTTVMECDWWLCVLICLPSGSWVGYCSAGIWVIHTGARSGCKKVTLLAVTVMMLMVWVLVYELIIAILTIWDIGPHSLKLK